MASSSASAGGKKNPTDNATFVQSAARIGATMREAWRGAAKSSITSALEDLQRGRPANMNRMGEIASHTAAVLHAKKFTRGSNHAMYLQQMASAMCEPTQIATLCDGSLYNTNTIASFSRNHRQTNNRLVTNPSTQGTKRAKYAQPKRDRCSKRLFPDLTTDNNRKAATSISAKSMAAASANNQESKSEVEVVSGHTPRKQRECMDLTHSDDGGQKKMPPTETEVQILEQTLLGHLDSAVSLPHGMNSTDGFAMNTNSTPYSSRRQPLLPITAQFYSSRNGTELCNDDSDPVILLLYHRMIRRCMVEEGTIDVDEGTATNESARHQTANIMANKQTVESFIKAKVHMDPKVASPALIKMYDYYYDDSYAPKK